MDFNFITLDLANNVIYACVAFEVWTDLHDCFSQKKAPLKFQTKRAITSL